MDTEREKHHRALIEFLKTIQRPNKLIDTVSLDDSLVTSGLIDSLAIIQIVVYLETTYGIDFAASGLDPERLSTLNGILDFIASTQR